MAKKPLFQNDQPGIDADLLTEQEIAELQGEVQAEVDAERKEEARKALKVKLKREARQKKGLDEPQVTLMVDLAPYCDRLLLDNVVYLQGRTYTVRATVAAVLNEQMQATWRHQSEIDGKPANFYQKARNTRFSMATGATTNGPVVNTSQLLKA